MKDTDPPTVVSAQGLTKCFGIKGPLSGDRAGDPSASGSTRAPGGCALDDVTFAIPRGRVVGLLGRNGSGKTTLLRCLQGLALPTAGRAMLFGIDGCKLADNHLAKLGVVHQENRFLPWMTARTHLDFMRTFYATWDLRRELKLIDAFELSMHERIDAMSPGAVQKLAIISATCHHPEVLLLDEPAASLDPPSREALFTTLFDLLRTDGPAIVISSHQLDDIERSVDWILCLERGRVAQDQALDVLQERYAQWRVHPAPGASQVWTGRFEEPWIRKATIEREGALLLVEGASEEQPAFEARHGVVVKAQPLRLAQMFGLWMTPNASGQGQAGSVSGVVR